MLDLHASNREQLVRNLKHLAACLRRTPAELIDILKQGDGTGVRETYVRPPAATRRLSVGSRESLRSAVKSCLELLALHVGNEPVRAGPFQLARDFVLVGEGNFNTERAKIDNRPLPQEDQLRQQFGPAFHLLYVTSDAAGRTVGYFRLYGFVAWIFLLAEEHGPPDIVTGLICDPTTGHWSGEIADSLAISMDWLAAAALDDMRSANLLNEVHRYAQQIAREREIGHIVEDEFERHGIRDGIEIDDEMTKTRLFDAIGARVTAMLVNVSYERPISWDEIEKLVRDAGD